MLGPAAWSVGVGCAELLLGVLVLLLAKQVLAWLSPFDLDQQLTQADNPAVGLALAGYLAATVILVIGVATRPDQLPASGPWELALRLGAQLAWCLVGLAALTLSRYTVALVVLDGLATSRELVEDRNLGAGAVLAGSALAAALVLAGALRGAATAPLAVVAFFALGQGALLLFGRLYRRVVGYDLLAELERDNPAAGVALGLSLVALGLVIANAVAAGQGGWGSRLAWFGAELMIGGAALLGLRQLTDWLLLPGTTLAEEIARDRNVNAALLEGGVAVGVAALVLVLL